MFRSTASRSLLRAPIATRQIRIAQARRFVSTETPAAPTRKSRSWKGTVLRWGLAAGAVYYYNTSTVFAEEPAFALQQPQYNDEDEDSSLPTLDSISAKSKQRQQVKQQLELQQQQQQQSLESNQTPAPSTILSKEEEAKAESSTPEGQEPQEGDAPEGAFNPETGEINWDCPCLGGMAHGPCGEEFKTAFSCFVFSEEDPKGMDCIDKFKGMQDCFRLHPEIYGSELDEEELDDQLEEQRVALESSEPGSESKVTPTGSESGEAAPAPVKEDQKTETKDAPSTAKTE
ncbi:Oxidoreductase [Arachnomyces sp. PD_36]|nr:Oxidoreductase [Arachnomyces sp. PD_36]